MRLKILVFVILSGCSSSETKNKLRDKLDRHFKDQPVTSLQDNSYLKKLKRYESDDDVVYTRDERIGPRGNFGQGAGTTAIGVGMGTGGMGSGFGLGFGLGQPTSGNAGCDHLFEKKDGRVTSYDYAGNCRSEMEDLLKATSKTVPK